MTKFLSVAVVAIAFSAGFAGIPAQALSNAQPMTRVAVAASGLQQAEAEAGGSHNGSVRNAKAEAHKFNDGQARDI